MKYKCKECGRSMKIDEEECLPCTSEGIVTSLAELIEAHPELEVVNDNCEPLLNNHKYV